MKLLWFAFGMGTLLSASLSASVSAHEVPRAALPGPRGGDEAGVECTALFGTKLVESVLLDDVSLLPDDATLLLASSVVDRNAPLGGSDPWWSYGVAGPRREPTDPDSPGLPYGSPLETPWDAWEDRGDLRSDWESLDPSDR